jgi:hypothetical protein
VPKEVFIPLWLVAAGINMWIGVSKEGYTVALLVVWKLSRG